MKKSNKHGFAISIDALFATILTLGVLTFIGLGAVTEETAISEQTINIRQAADDAFTALNNSGILATYLADSELTPTTLANLSDPENPGIYYEAKRLLPQNLGLKVAISEYRAVDDLDIACRTTKKFEDCFGTAPFATQQFSESRLLDKEVIHGKKIVIMKETGQGEEIPEVGRTCVPEQLLELEEEKSAVNAMLQSEPLELSLETGIEVRDPDTGTALTSVSCSSTAAAEIIAKARSTTRDPVAIILAMDRSGSMRTYDILTQEISGVLNYGECGEEDDVWMPGQYGNGLYFNGINQFIECGTNPAFNSDDELTIALWVKFDDPDYANPYTLAGKETGHYYYEGYMFRYNPTSNEFQFYGDGSNPVTGMFDLGTEWHHIAVTVSGTTGTIYVDAFPVTTDSDFDGLTSNGDNFRIGNSPTQDYYGDYFYGTMDDFRIFDRALTPEEIQTIIVNGDVASNLIAQYKLDETQGFVAYDSSGNELHCSLENWRHIYSQRAWEPGEINNALYFNGINQYVEMDSDTSLDVQDFTFATWFNKSTTAGMSSPVIFMRGDSQGDNEIFIGFLDDTTDTILLILNNESHSIDTGIELGLGWHHLAVTAIDSVMPGLKNAYIYIDGESVGGADYEYTVFDFGSSKAWLGADSDSFNGSLGNYWHGYLDDARLYNRPLNATEVGELFSGTEQTGLISHWKMDESSGYTASDSQGPNNGTLINWDLEVGEGCQYILGDPAIESTNCPVEKENFDQFTDRDEVTSYDIGPIYSLINQLPDPNDYLTFTADSTTYDGVCRADSYNTYMRLWVRRPDAVIESNDSYAYREVISSGDISNGSYDMIVWSDDPVDYHIYLTQAIRGGVYGIPLGGGTKDGFYNPPENYCSNYDNNKPLYTFDLSAYDQVTSMRIYMDYDEYRTAGGECGYPSFTAGYKSTGAEWVDDAQVGRSMRFGGGNRANYIEVPANPALDVQEFSMSLWFKGCSTYIDSPWRYSKMAGRENSEQGKEMFVGFYHSYEDRIQVWLGGENSHYFDGGINLWDDQWHHLVVTYDSATMKAYVDNLPYGADWSIGEVALDFGDGRFLIGRNPTQDTYCPSFCGGLDEIRLYDKALNTTEINNIYSDESTGTQHIDATGNLVGFWALDETTGYAAADSSGSGLNGIAHLDQNWTDTTCGTGDTGGPWNCLNSTLTPAPGGPYFGGKWETWGWSDVDIAVDSVIYSATQNWGNVWGSDQSETVSGGTCSDQPCETTAIPATDPYTNCPINTGYSMEELPGIDNAMMIGEYEVNTDLTGLHTVIDFDYSAGSAAVCPGAAMSYEMPFDLNNWYNIYAVKGEHVSSGITPTTLPKTIWINDNSSTSWWVQYWDWVSGPPVDYGWYRVWGWAEENVSYNIKWMLSRIDGAKNSAYSFVDNATWKEDDVIGLVSFSTGTILDQELTIDRDLVKDAIEALDTGGETAIADAITTAAAELIGSEAGRFLVLLTDGRANVCSGGVPCLETPAIADAITAANAARAEGSDITIFIVGFADESIIGTYEDDLREIALDRDDARYSDDCTSGVLEHCGKYYFAADEETLQEMYDLIALEILRSVGDIDISFPVPDGMQLISYDNAACGIWNDSIGDFVEGTTDGCVGECSSGEAVCYAGETVEYNERAIGGFTGNLWWAARFEAVLPCNESNCDQDYILFPPVGTSFVEGATSEMVEWDNTDGEDVICEGAENTNCYKRIVFKYSDLNVEFTYGLLATASNDVTIDLNISNDGYNNIQIGRATATGLLVEFYKMDKSNKLNISVGGCDLYLGDRAPVKLKCDASSGDELFIAMPDDILEPDSTCSWREGLCEMPNYQPNDYKIRVKNIELSGCPGNNCEGTIIAEINSGGTIGECALYNEANLFCSGERFRLFEINYYVWKK